MHCSTDLPTRPGFVYNPIVANNSRSYQAISSSTNLPQFDCSKGLGTLTIRERTANSYGASSPVVELLTAIALMTSRSMPLALSHEAFLKRSVFKVANEVTIASRARLSTLRRPTAPSPCAAWISIRGAVRWRWVVRGAWLQANGLVGIEMAGHSLNGDWDTTLLNFHRGRSLTP